MILFLFMLTNCVYANPISVPDILTKPIAERVKEFRDLRDDGHKILSAAAFDVHNNLQLRWRALTTMGRMNADEFQKDLEKALLSREWFMRNAALIAIQNSAREVALRWSTKLLNDPALVVRTQAVRNLIQIDGREAESKLWEQMFSRANFRGNESLWVRAHIAEALARFGLKGRTENFHRLLLDPDRRLHKWAILGLENSTGMKMGDKNVPLEVRREQWLERLGAQEI
jgi:HEAT repeat protein